MGKTLEKLASGKDINVLSEEASDKPIGVQKGSIKRKNSGFDWNAVTPKKRLQRRKHRPKVFKEEKTSRTPKPATPRPDTVEQSGGKGSTSCKVKYVRRIKDVIPSSETTPNALGEIVDAESKLEAKSVRRCLTFDLNSSTYQSKNECSKLLQIPVPPAEISKKMCASIKQMQFLKSSVKPFKALARETACLNSAAVNSQSSSEVAQRNRNSNRISYAPPKGTKKVHLSFDEAGVPNSSQDFSFADSQRFMEKYQEQDSERILSFDQAERYVQNNPALGPGEASLISFGSFSRNSTPM